MTWGLSLDLFGRCNTGSNWIHKKPLNRKNLCHIRIPNEDSKLEEKLNFLQHTANLRGDRWERVNTNEQMSIATKQTISILMSQSTQATKMCLWLGKKPWHKLNAPLLFRSKMEDSLSWTKGQLVALSGAPSVTRCCYWLELVCFLLQCYNATVS